MSPAVCPDTGRILSYSSAEVIEVAGITYRQLTYWAAAGYLRPADTAPGKGRDHEWPEGEPEVARRMGRLTAAGLLPAIAASVARDSWPEAEIAPGVVVTVTDPEAGP